MARHLLEPQDVVSAPELAVLALLHAVIDMSIRSLLAAHPDLQNDALEDNHNSPCQAIARSIIISASQLFEPIRAYRKAVVDKEISSADIPF